jgi:Flp pilus assembly pilin Flp
MKTNMKRKEGQAMVEYIIIVVIVAIAALVIFGLFSDTIRQKLGGAVEEMGGDTQGAEDTSSLEYLRDLGDDGSN